MAKRTLKAGITGRIEFVWIQDSAATDGRGKGGLLFSTAGWKAYYIRPGSAPVSISLVTQTVTGAYASGGFVELDSANMLGAYRIDVPDAVFAVGVDHALVMLSGPTGAAPVVLEYDLVAYDPQDTIRLGLTALPAVAQGNAGQLALGDATGRPTALVSVGTGAGQINVAAGVVPASLSSTERTSLIDALLTRDFSAVANPTVRCVLNALRALVNKVTIAGGTMTVYREDDTTAAWTAAVTGTAGADPITTVDPT